MMIYVNNSTYSDLYYPFNSLCFIVGNFYSDVYITNSEFKNSVLSNIAIVVYIVGNVVIQNITFTNFSDTIKYKINKQVNQFFI